VMLMAKRRLAPVDNDNLGDVDKKDHSDSVFYKQFLPSLYSHNSMHRVRTLSVHNENEGKGSSRTSLITVIRANVYRPNRLDL